MLLSDPSHDRRIRLRLDAHDIRATLRRQPVQLLDISLTGLRFETTTRLNLEGSHEFHLDTEVGEFDVSGRIVWCCGAGLVDTSERQLTPLYRAGMRFGPLALQDARLLRELIERRASEVELDDEEGSAQEEVTSQFRREDLLSVIHRAESRCPRDPHEMSSEEISRIIEDVMR